VTLLLIEINLMHKNQAVQIQIINTQTRIKLWNHISDQISNRIYNKIWVRVGKQVDNRVKNQIWNQINKTR